jgi:hypothetical protein
MLEIAIASWLALFSAPEFKKKTFLDFTQVKLTGQVVRPSLTRVHVRGRTTFRPLIQARENFRPELEKSLEAL